MIATGSADGQIQVYDLSNENPALATCWQKISNNSRGQIYGVCYNPLSTCSNPNPKFNQIIPQLLSYGADGIIRIYSAKKGKYSF